MDIFDKIKSNDPNKILDEVAARIKEMKKLSKDNPLFLMEKYMPEEEQRLYWETKKQKMIEYQMNKGYSDGKDLKHLAMIPQLVYNANPQYWQEIIQTRDYRRHPYFLVTNPYVKDLRLA